MGLGPMKLRALREYVEVVRGMLAGETVPWTAEGSTHKVRFLNPEVGLVRVGDRIPLHLSAFAPKARAMAAELADGWMNFVTVSAMALYEVGAMNDTCRAAGRDPETLYKTGFTLGCVLQDGEDAGSPRARAQAGPLVSVLFHALTEGTVKASLMPPELQAAADEYRRLHEDAGPDDERHLRLHAGHLLHVRPEEERFVTPELIRNGTFTGTVDELRDRIRELRDGGYDQLAVQLVTGHESAIDDWARVFEGV
jgi:5,10-methylenetetrahydromethanopterin reductase